MKKTFAGAAARAANSRRAPLAVLVTTMVVLGTAIGTGVAFAQDPAEQGTTGSSTSSASTSTSDPTTSTSDPTTTSTSDQPASDGKPSQETTTEGQTTTTSDTLNAAAATAIEPRAVTTETLQNGCVKIDNVSDVTDTSTVTVTVNTVVMVFVFDVFNGEDPNEAIGASWTSDVPFVGHIDVKAGSGADATATTSYPSPGTTSGAVSHPSGKGISHIDICGGPGTTTTSTATTSTGSTTTTTSTGTTSTGTTSTGTTSTGTTSTGTTSTGTTSTDTTSTGTTSTGTTTGTGGTAGTTAAGGVAGAVAGGGGGGNDGGGEGAVAGEATEGDGGLAFTGLHVPALILIALGMATAGIVLRKKLEDAA